MRQNIKLIDAHAAFGGAIDINSPRIEKADILAEMKRLAVSKAVVRGLFPRHGGDTVVINRQLFRNCAKEPRLLPCPLLIPSGGNDLPPEEEQIDSFIKQGARMTWIRPGTGTGSDQYNLTETVSGRMFEALAKRRMPILCLMDLVSLADMDMLLRRHDGLRIIAANVSYGQLRIILPMLKAYSDFYLATGHAAAENNFLTAMERSGVIHKIFFGTGFPESEPMTAISELMYADISEQNRRAVGAENIMRLLNDVKP